MWQKRFGRYTFRAYRIDKTKYLRIGNWTWTYFVLRGPTPFQRRLWHIFPSFQPRPRPTDARHVITLSLPFPRGEIDIEIFRHPAR